MRHCSTNTRTRTLNLREGIKKFWFEVSSWESGMQVFSARQNYHWSTSTSRYDHQEIQAWEFTLLDASQVGNSLGWPAYQWMPDGHLSTLWVSAKSYASFKLVPVNSLVIASRSNVTVSLLFIHTFWRSSVFINNELDKHCTPSGEQNWTMGAVLPQFRDISERVRKHYHHSIWL